MIALVVQSSFPCTISKHNSFVCNKSHVSLSASLQFLSTSRDRKLVKSPKVYDVLVHKYQFSPQVASIVASELRRCRSPEIADSTLSFLIESGLSSTQLQKIAKFRPRILTAGSESDIKFKIRIFQKLGLSPEDIAKVISSQLRILCLSAKNNIIPSLSLLRDLLGSNRDVARLLVRNPGFLTADLEKTLVPNVAFLKSFGVTMEQIRILLFNFPRCLLIRPDIMRESVDRAKEMGFCQSSRMFVYGVRLFASMSKETWEFKWQAFRDLGFSDSDITTMLRKAPAVFNLSMVKIKMVKELVLATGKFDISSIANNPVSLGYSIEKRIMPRLEILGILESRNLIKKWPSLSEIGSLSDERFMERFVGPYLDELGEEYDIKSRVMGEKVVNLNSEEVVLR